MNEDVLRSIGDRYKRLLICDTQARLPGMAVIAPETISENDCCVLIGAASILALSERHDDKGVAYEICTRIVALFGSKDSRFVLSARYILSRLGNFPGRKLLDFRYPRSIEAIRNENVSLFLEALTREIENTVEDASGEPMALTDFQFDTLQAFDAAKSVSVSAPTSAGKSFVLSLEVIRRLKVSPGSCLIYLVPTRALIRQVVLHLREDLRKAGLSRVPLRSVPQAVLKENAPDGVIFVLTQERLLSLLFSNPDEIWITTLIVDEAQGVGDGARGVLLQTAIEKVKSRFPNVDILFASPKASNPEYLLDLFEISDGTSTIEEHSPVSQNVILVQRGSERDTVNFQLLANDEVIDLGERDLGFSIHNLSIIQRRSQLAVAIGTINGSCIVYANRAYDAEAIAGQIANKLTESVIIDPRIQEFIQFLTEHVHPEYGLINILKKGVAFHFGNMPGSVRAGVEELCRSGKLSFICCTSTLLQGVNLPARDIIVENPKKGLGHPMSRADFVNLSGRAGRLLHEFHGNVWCLMPKLWDEKCYKGESLHKIESAFDRCLRDGGTALQQLLESGSKLEDEVRDVAIASFGRTYTEFITVGKLEKLEKVVPLVNRDYLSSTVEKLKNLKFVLPIDTIARNHGIFPILLEELFAELCNVEDPRDLMPIAPYMPGTFVRLRKIFEIVERVLQQDPKGRFSYYCSLAAPWIHHHHLKDIISNRISYLQSKSVAVNVHDTINEVIEDLEKVIRYRFVKHMRAYNDVLAYVLQCRGLNEEAERLVPMHLYLECGGSDPNVLGLISVGLSRTSALLCRKLIPRDIGPEQCMEILTKINLDAVRLPDFCKREIAYLVRGAS